MKIYLIGSLKNPEIPTIANELRAEGYDVFDDWYAAGPNADDHWRDYEKGRERTFVQALNTVFARNAFEFDFRHLWAADVAVLVLPAGKSGHLEAGWARGQGKSLYVLVDSPDRWDMMYQFANGVTSNMDGIKYLLKRETDIRQRKQDAAEQATGGANVSPV